MSSATVVAVRAFVATAVLSTLAACGSGGGPAPATRGSYKIGAPYTISGVTYTPTEEFNHVESGVASWYGPGFHGKATANGERYDQHGHTAAHRTLQMPSVVKVTNLDNGLSTVVRINDRGPFAHNRVIDLSRAAANDLNMMQSGTARVRIEQLSSESQTVKEVAQGGGGPAEQAKALERLASNKRSGTTPTMTATAQAAAPTPQPPPVQAAPPPNPRVPAGPTVPAAVAAGPAPAGPPLFTPVSATGGSFWVQTGAFSSVANAERQRGAIAGFGTSEIAQGSSAGRDVYRVRIGPYASADAAGMVAERLKSSGYGDARVVTD